MTILKRIALLPTRTAARLWTEATTRSGRRRVRRRISSRLLVLAVACAWAMPFTNAFWSDQLDYFIDGRVVVSDQEHAPLLNTAVVLLPAPAENDDPENLQPYTRIDPGEGLPEVEQPEDAALWLWTDVDGLFASMHVTPGVPYRVEVRRADCAPVLFGVREFELWTPWTRRLYLQVPPCGGTS